MRLGVTVFLTDLDIGPADLARAVESRGFDSLYLPEHTHLPVRADTPPGLVEGVTLENYRRSLDPMVALAQAAAVTTALSLGTGITLVAQHDPICLAKQIATLDHVSGGRFTLGVGFGWNKAEAEDHGLDFSQRRAVVRDHLGCMQALWSQDQAEFHGPFTNLQPTWAWPKTVQQPRVRTLVGGGATDAVFSTIVDCADGWMPVGGSGLAESIPKLRQLAEEAGRDPDTLHIVPFGTIPTVAKLEYFATIGIDEVIIRVPSGPASTMEGALDELVPLLAVAPEANSPRTNLRSTT
jgi:probable F420-dependent oxidoreductase